MYEGDPYGDEIEGGEDKNDGLNALVSLLDNFITIQNLQYVLGFNKDIDQGVHNLTTPERHVSDFSILFICLIGNFLFISSHWCDL